MLLLGYIINGQTVGTDLSFWNNDDLNGNPAFVISNSVTSGYQDISSMENWDTFGYNSGVDFNYIRNIIQGLVVAIVTPNFSNWNGLTLSQKLLACKYIVAPYALRVPSVVTDDEDKENWYNVVVATNGVAIGQLQGRALIFQKMRIAIAEYTRTGLVSLSQSQQLFVDTFLLVQYYINANSPDFKYWFNNTVGTPYENAGFAQATYIPSNLHAEILQKVNDIYNGVIF